MSALLVTGTSTDVGKTIATAALAAAVQAAGASVAVCKPAQTGEPPGSGGDLAVVERLVGVGPAGVTTTVELARYPEPLAPDTAARRAGMTELTRTQVVAAARELGRDHDLALIEGAGGLLVRLGAGGFTLRDVAADLGAPVLLVADPALGTLNHCALTVEALRSAGVRCAGIVLGSWPDEPDLAMRCNLEDLPSVTGVELVGRIPAAVGSLDRTRFTAQAPGWFDQNWLASLV